MQTGAKVDLIRHGSVAVLLCEQPPVNAIGHPIRQGLLSGLETALDEVSIGSIVIACGGAAFFAGADISEFSSEERPPTADSLFEKIEASPKPIVAAMHTRALGGGLELALTCHHRLAAGGTVFGFPEVKLGLIPGLGGTQRFVRIAGFDAALKFIPTGQLISTGEALAMGLLDHVVTKETLLSDAIAFAGKLTSVEPTRLARDREDRMVAARRNPPPFQEIRDKLKRRLRGLQAPLACVDAIEAALDSTFDAALANERRIFAECLASEESASLTYLFFAERAARKISGLASAALPVRHVGIVGGGTMGRGILIAVLEAGYVARLVEQDQDAVRACSDGVAAHFARQRSRNLLSDMELESIRSRMTISTDWAELAGCDLVIEAVFENLDLKRRIFDRLSSVVSPRTILATNTSGLSVAEIGRGAASRQNVLGLHFFSPANVMKLLEIVRAPETSDIALATGLAFAKSLEKVAVVARDVDGFIGNRVFDAYWREAELIVEEGASPYDVDAALEEFGMAMGPFAVSDLAGLDVGHDIRVRQAASHSALERVPGAEEAVFQAGRLGLKTGEGWYDYVSGRRTPSDVVLSLIEEHRRSHQLAGRRHTRNDIVLRCLGGLLGEALDILHEGVAARPSDIDLVAVHGYGFPQSVGGPMRWLETTGHEQFGSWAFRANFPFVESLLNRSAQVTT